MAIHRFARMNSIPPDSGGCIDVYQVWAMQMFPAWQNGAMVAVPWAIVEEHGKGRASMRLAGQLRMCCNEVCGAHKPRRCSCLMTARRRRQQI
ncbi:MAG TPA: hypothetical protein VK110_05415 [Salinisphaeraceae bacterium]|nr:hypothetical protein [Salinisphaeraceae bacterium]